MNLAMATSGGEPSTQHACRRAYGQLRIFCVSFFQSELTVFRKRGIARSMDFRLDDEQEMIVQTVRRFADRELRNWAADADRAGTPPDKLAVTARDVGFYLDAIPADADGLLDGNYSHLTRALRGFELGRGCAALAALLETNVEPALAVGAWGSPAAKRALYGSLASGGLAAYYHDHRASFEIEDDGGGVRLS